MKKLFSLVIGIAMLLMISTPVSAKQVVTNECHNHSDCSTGIDKEVPLTFGMSPQKQKINVMPADMDLITPMAQCKHTSYSDWTTIRAWYKPPKKFGDCKILVQYQTRYCKKCNAAFARELETPLFHIKTGDSSLWRCIICGASGGIASVGDLQDK